jgi:hypothetical protein
MRCSVSAEQEVGPAAALMALRIWHCTLSAQSRNERNINPRCILKAHMQGHACKGMHMALRIKRNIPERVLVHYSARSVLITVHVLKRMRLECHCKSTLHCAS